jgi:glycosyltransferase involved in cell wall biosynthesis
MTFSLGNSDFHQPRVGHQISKSNRKQPRILMTVDAVGGVWRYALDLATELVEWGIETIFVGFGPPPSEHQLGEASGKGVVIWTDAPLDWTTDREDRLDEIPDLLANLVASNEIDLVHLNLPSQGAGLDVDVPVVVMSHSCVVTWFRAVRDSAPPADWIWQKQRNRRGFDRADIVVSPSESHAEALRLSYGPIPHLEVVHNSSRAPLCSPPKENLVFAAGRWWDEGKNGAVLDLAAPCLEWPLVMAGASFGPNGQRCRFANAKHVEHLAHEETMALMSRAAIVVSPSVYEPFGLVPLEAARHGAALVLADISTYRELWDGAAVFADPRDPRAFADAVNRLTSEAMLRMNLARLAQKRSSTFSPVAQARAMAEIYTRLTRGLTAPQPWSLA